MFTGIVEDCGKVKYIRGTKLCIKSSLLGVPLGASLMVDGVCLTVKTEISPGVYELDIGQETLKITALKKLRPGSEVNLERAMMLSSRIDGHIVYGHVMAIGKIISLRTQNNTRLFKIKSTKNIINKLQEKGSVAVNGVSLTINKIEKDFFSVGVIPETLKRTNLKNLSASSEVNLEADMLLSARQIL